MRFSFLLAATTAFLLSVGPICAKSADPVQISPDTYMIFREDHGGIFGSLAKLKMKIIREANDFAAKQGKIAIPLSSHEVPMRGGPAQWASFEYQFRVVSKDDPEARRTSLMPRPDVVVETDSHISADIHTKDDTEKPKDAYDELIKLDDLRKRGALTDAEFEAEKAKLLGKPAGAAPQGQAPPSQVLHSDDLYTKLVKLDELRKKGILTDAEFEVQKKKLLDSQQP
ncbi:MAG: SHOCT domain-containing protein [Acidobacteriota bacterium]